MKTKKMKASVLVMSLLIMFAIVIIALSATLVSIRERKISIGSGKSSRAFQTAQTGVEEAMKVIITDLNNSSSVNDIVPNLTGSNCIGGIIEKDNYTIELKDKDGNKIACDDITGKTIKDVLSIKSIGKEGENQKRAIEAAVAATITPGVTGGCMVIKSGSNWNVLSSTVWGEGCDSGENGTDANFTTICDDIKLLTAGVECGMVSYINYGGGEYVTCLCMNEP